MNHSLYIDLSKADKAPSASAGGPTPAKQMPKSGAVEYDYTSEIPKGSSRPWEPTGSGGYKAPKSTATSSPGKGPSGSPGTSGPSVSSRAFEGKPIKAPEGVSSKQSILSSNPEDFKDHSVTDHYKIMSEVAHDDKLAGMHQKLIQDKTRKFSADEHSKLSQELKDHHEKSPNMLIQMASDYHAESADRANNVRAKAHTSASSDAKKTSRDASAKKVASDAKDKKAEAKSKKDTEKRRQTVQASGKAAKKRQDKSTDKASKQKDSREKAEKKRTAAPKDKGPKENPDSPEMQRVKATDHTSRASKLSENLTTHLDNKESGLPPEDFGRLKEVQRLADAHSKLSEITPQHEKELKAAEQMAGKHGSSSSDEQAQKDKKDPHVEAVQQAAHQEDAKTLKDNLDAHLEDPEISEMKRAKLKKIREVLDQYGEGPVTDDQAKQLKELQKLSGSEGKDPPKEGKGSGGASTSSSSTGTASARALGSRLGAASASEDNAGDLGAAGIDYATEGAVQAGHHLLSRNKNNTTKKSVRLFLSGGK